MGRRFNRALLLAPILGVVALWQGFVNSGNGYMAFGLFGIVMGVLLLLAFFIGLCRVFLR